MSIGRFQVGIAVLLRSPNDKYLLLRRSEDKDFGAGSWECVTGRLDQGEGFIEALHREVYEELGVKVRIEFIVGVGHFYRGDPCPENEVVTVAFCCTIDDPEAIELSAEHSEYHWVSAEEVDDLFAREWWLQRLIRRAEMIRARLPARLLAYYQENGFELG